MMQLYRTLFGLLIVYAVSTCHGLRTRIVNGSKARLGEFPYQAAVQANNDTLCGGVVIDKYHILTASHCLLEHISMYQIKSIEKFFHANPNCRLSYKTVLCNVEPELFSVLVGTVDQNSQSNPGRWHRVVEVKVHEKFEWGDGWPNDIALLKLEKPIVFDKYVGSAVLPKAGEELKNGQTAVISGFGRLNLNTNGSSILYKTEVFIEENNSCQTYYHKETIRSTNFCTRSKRVTGTCEGDSGGPITVDGKVVGLASFSLDDGCAGESMRPQVHTRISEYMDWIDSYRKL